MNQLYLGSDFYIEPRKGVYINDEIPVVPFAKIFDARVHRLNPLQNLSYKKLRQIRATFDTLFPGGENTLTKMTGLSYLADALDHVGGTTTMVDLLPEPDKKSTTGHVWAYERVRDLMRSPVLRQMLCSPTSFAFPPDAVILCRVNRAELTDFDADAITLFIMATYPGQIIVPAFDFYGRDMHIALLREQRLIAGVRSLKRIERRYPDLHDELLLIKEKTVAGALHPDAVTLAQAAGLRPDPTREDNPYNRFIIDAMKPPEKSEPVPLWAPPQLLVPVVQKREIKPWTD